MARAAIGKELNVTPAWVTQLKAKVIKKLQNENRAKKIKPLFYSYEEMRAEITRRDEQIYELTNTLR